MAEEIPAFLNGQLVNCSQSDLGSLVFRRNCSSCTRRRRRCDGQRPRCERCVKNDSDCLYALDKVRTTRGKDPKPVRDGSSMVDQPFHQQVHFQTHPVSFPSETINYADYPREVHKRGVQEQAFPDFVEPLFQTASKGDILSMLNAYDIAINSPVLPNENQLRRRTMSVNLDGNLLPQYEDGEPFTCDDLCTRFVRELIEYLPPGLLVLPWSGLPPHPVYDHLRNTFLQRPIAKKSTSPLWCSFPPVAMLQLYLSDFYTYLDLAVVRLRGYGWDTPANSVDALRAECILIMFVGLILLKNTDTDPTHAQLTSNFDRILPDVVFRYLRILGVDNAHSLTLSPRLEWNLADALYLRRIWFFWSCIDQSFAVMRYRLPLAVARLPVMPAVSQADAITHAATIQSAALAILGMPRSDLVPQTGYTNDQKGAESSLSELWTIGGMDFVSLYAASMGLLEVWGQVLDWRLHVHDGNVPLAATATSPIHPDNPRRRYFEDLIGQWRYKDSVNGLWILGLKVLRGTLVEDHSRVSFIANGKNPDGSLARGFNQVFDLETSWIMASNHAGGVISTLMNLFAWQYVVHPAVDHLIMLKDMNRKRALNLKVGVGADHVAQVLHSHVHVLTKSYLIWSRLLLLHVLGLEVRAQHPGKYMDFTFLANAIPNPIPRQSVMVNVWLLAELMHMITEGRRVLKHDATLYSYRVHADDRRVLLHRTDSSGNKTILEPDMSDYVNVANDEFTRDVLSVLGRLYGDGEIDWMRLDADVDKVMLKSISLFTVMFRVMQVQSSLGYHRATYALELSAGKLEQPPGPIGLKGMCHAYMELPLD